MTLAEVRDNVEMLIRRFDGQPGVELLGVVHEMLENTDCSCLPAPRPDSAVVLTPDFTRSRTKNRPQPPLDAS